MATAIIENNPQIMKDRVRDRGDVLQEGQGKSESIAVSSTGTGLRGQGKTPRGFRTETFIAPPEESAKHSE